MDDHMDRLERGMRYAGLQPLISGKEMAGVIEKVIAANIGQFAADDDCWICAQVTPGVGFPHPMMKGKRTERTVMAYVNRLPYDEYYTCYETGKPAFVPIQRNVPAGVADPRGKTRFRLHYFMAKLEAGLRDPGAFALLLDADGFVTEGTGANFFIASQGVLYTSTTRNILEGISRRVVIELAHELGIPVVERDLTLYDVYSADEAFWTTSSYCMLPCSRVNHMPMKQTPGPLFTRLIKAWSESAGVDIIAQAKKYRHVSSDVWRESVDKKARKERAKK
jgi:branched-chain amino acid aminotransferase